MTRLRFLATPSLSVSLGLLLVFSSGCREQGTTSQINLIQVPRVTRVDLTDLPGQTLAFHQAAADGDLNRIRMFPDQGVPVDVRGEEGHTALMWAASQGHVDSVRYLLQVGADPDLVDDSGWTAREIAAAHGYTQTVRVLQDAAKSSESK